MKVYKKLVRDKIPEIIGVDKCTYKEIKDLDKKLDLLRAKLLEESNEFIEANTNYNNSPSKEYYNNMIEELADIEEVLHSFGKLYDIYPEDVEKRRKDKAEEKGSFNNYIFLDKVDK